MKYKFIGYIDNPVITNNFLIPLYKEIETNLIYSIKKIKNKPEINKHKQFDISNFKYDKVVLINENSEYSHFLEEKNIIIYKIKKDVFLNEFDNAFFDLLKKIHIGEVKSEILIENFCKIYSIQLLELLNKKIIKLIFEIYKNPKITSQKVRIARNFSSRLSISQKIELLSKNEVEFKHSLEKFISQFYNKRRIKLKIDSPKVREISALKKRTARIIKSTNKK